MQKSSEWGSSPAVRPAGATGRLQVAHVLGAASGWADASLARLVFGGLSGVGVSGL